MTLDVPSRRALLGLARRAVNEVAGGDPSPPLVPHGPRPTILDQRKGAFVTITKRARLRGCIGRVEPDAPLHTLIPDVARAAARSDPRFPPVERRELPAVTIEISLLSAPAVLDDPEQVVVGRHGLLVRAGGRHGLLLPQVAVEYAWTREQFLDEVCRKAGLPPGAWRNDGALLLAFTAEVFSERE